MFRALHILTTFTIATLATLVIACSDDKPSSDPGSGQINPSISVNTEVIIAANATQSGDMITAPETDLFHIKLSESNSGKAHIWESINDFPPHDYYNAGDYLLEAFYGDPDKEGFDCPYFYGSTTISLSDNDIISPHLTCSLANCMIKVTYTKSFIDYFPEYHATLHADGGSYVNYEANETRPACIKPGNISLALTLTLPDGDILTFQPVKISEAKARHFYEATVSLSFNDSSYPVVTISFDENVLSDDVAVTLSPSFINAAPPLIKAIGFVSEETLLISEGTVPDHRIAFEYDCADAASILLTTSSRALLKKGWPGETDLANIDKSDLKAIEDLGLRFCPADGSDPGTIDITDVIPNILYDGSNGPARFSVSVRDRISKTAGPISINVNIEPMDLTVVGLSDAIVGINEAEIKIQCPSSQLEKNVSIEVKSDNTDWEKANIISVTDNGQSTYTFRFSVPDGNGNIKVRALYCGQIKTTSEIKRVSPPFEIAVDAFALSAIVRIIPEDPEMLGLITSCASIYANGKHTLMLSRNREEGTITVTGLQENCRYTFKATVMPNPSQSEYSKDVTVTTEHCRQPPNADFEEVKNTIDYKDMLSGGRYSQNIVAIYNQQNKTTYTLSTPEDWANTNGKTFCPAAKNHNTWYMIPSVYTVTEAYSGAYAVRLDNVAWDPAGEAIPDYLQESQPYVKYNRNIPQIANRAVGKLFLGFYSFDAITGTEVYDEGIKIDSRPTALNGFYKYLPGADSPTDKGMAHVEVIGDLNGASVVIARGSTELNPAASYTAFRVQLEYLRFGIKATKIKIMMASSSKYGTIEEETHSVITTPDPASATSTGSSLWIDALSFSY